MSGRRDSYVLVQALVLVAARRSEPRYRPRLSAHGQEERLALRVEKRDRYATVLAYGDGQIALAQSVSNGRDDLHGPPRLASPSHAELLVFRVNEGDHGASFGVQCQGRDLTDRRRKNVLEHHGPRLYLGRTSETRAPEHQSAPWIAAECVAGQSCDAAADTHSPWRGRLGRLC